MEYDEFSQVEFLIKLSKYRLTLISFRKLFFKKSLWREAYYKPLRPAGSNFLFVLSLFCVDDGD